MSKRITAAPTTKLTRSDTNVIRDHVGPARKHQVNKTPCSLCHQVVEELKYHYDICEPCHQNDMESGSDTEEEPIEEAQDLVSLGKGNQPSDDESDESDWEDEEDEPLEEKEESVKQNAKVTPQ